MLITTKQIRHPPGSDINVDQFKIALDKSLVDVNEGDVEQYVPFYSSCYLDGSNASLNMRPPFFPPGNQTHDRKHQKKKGSHSC